MIPIMAQWGPKQAFDRPTMIPIMAQKDRNSASILQP
jgi:hypothetical protein